jgi:hypothetical protein
MMHMVELSASTGEPTGWHFEPSVSYEVPAGLRGAVVGAGATQAEAIGNARKSLLKVRRERRRLLRPARVT